MAAGSVGEISFELNFDGSKLTAGINDACKKINDKFKQSFSNAGKTAAAAIKSSNEDINRILEDAEKSVKSKAASIASIYRKEGYSQKDAFEKAWSHIERSSSAGTKKIKKQLKGISGKTKEVTEKMQGYFSKSFTDIAKKIGLALASAFAIKKLADFGRSCIELGSDLAEVQNVVDVTFPAMSKKVDEFAQKAAASFGLSETMAKRYAGTFGAMAKAFGFTEGAAYEMGTTLTGLAGDVASFYNISQDEAYTKLKSVFTGETESLKDLGIVMTQTALDSYAMANGFGKATAQMSEAEKVALRYKFVQGQLTGAAGDFSRTADGWANQMRILTLQMESFKATIGQGLINLFSPILKVVNTLIGKLMTLANAFKAFTELITGKRAEAGGGGAAKSLAEATENAEGLAEATEGIGEAAGKSAKAMAGLSGFDKLNNLSGASGGGSGSGAGNAVGASVDFGSLAEGENVVEKLDASLSPVLQKLQALAGLVKEGFQANFDLSGFERVKESCKTIGGSIQEIFADKGLQESFSGLLDNLAYSVGAAGGNFLARGSSLAAMLFEGIGQYFQENKSEIPRKLAEMLNSFSKLLDIHNSMDGLWTEISAVLTGPGGAKITNSIVDIFANGFLNAGTLAAKFGAGLAGAIAQPLLENKGRIKEALENTLEPLAGGFGRIKQLFQDTWDKVFEAYDTYISPSLERIGDGLSGVFGAVLDAYNEYIAPVLGYIQEQFSVLCDQHIQPAIDSFMELAGKAVDAVSRVWDAVSPFVAYFVEEAIKDAAAAIKYLWDIIQAIAEGVIGILKAAIDALSGLIDFLVGVFTGDWEKAWDGIKQFVESIWAKIKSFLKGIWESIKALFAPVADYFKGRFGLAAKGIKETFSPIGKFFSGVWANIKSAFSNVTGWFKDKFSSAWEAVKNVFSKGGKIFDGIKDGILDGLKAVVNGLIGGINKVISVPFDGLNTALRKIKGIEIVGVKPFDWISEISTPQIPLLANGGYVKANTPQLAMIGDNRHQGEVVAPEGKLQELLDKAVSRAGAGDRELYALLRDILRVLKSMDSKELTAVVRASEIYQAWKAEDRARKLRTGGV